MPHKRAKRTVREQERKNTGTDHAPPKSSLENEAIPKGAMRIFNALSVREEYKKRKRDPADEDQGVNKKRKEGGKGNDGKGDGKGKLKILPGESMQHFNKRVEDDMRPLVRSAAQLARARQREAVKEEMKAKKEKKNKKKPVQATSPSPPPERKVEKEKEEKHADKPKEFAQLSISAPRRLNDIAQAPPEFTRLPRGAAASSSSKLGVGKGGKGEILSMAQRSMMEKERERAIVRYRELKARRMEAAGV